MTNTIFQNEILNLPVALKIAVPGEASSQHNGVVSGLSDKTITITHNTNSGIVSTTYNLDYVVLVQWLVAAPTEEVAK